jgi:uncharacterized membrane protein
MSIGRARCSASLASFGLFDFPGVEFSVCKLGGKFSLSLRKYSDGVSASEGLKNRVGPCQWDDNCRNTVSGLERTKRSSERKRV